MPNLSSSTLPGMPQNFWKNIGLVRYLPDVSQNPVYRRFSGQSAATFYKYIAKWCAMQAFQTHAGRYVAGRATAAAATSTCLSIRSSSASNMSITFICSAVNATTCSFMASTVASASVSRICTV